MAGGKTIPSVYCLIDGTLEADALNVFPAPGKQHASEHRV